MARRQLHNVVVPNDAQTLTRSELQQQLATQGLLEGDSAIVEQISLGAGEQLLYGAYRGQYAQKLATELEELFNASGFEEIPFFATEGTSPEDGYYSVRDVTKAPFDPRVEEVNTFEGTITKKGTRSSHYRAVETTISQLDHPFGNDLEARIAIPAASTKRRWFDPQAATIAEATSITTRTGEFDDVDVFDVDAAPGDHSVLLFEVPYDQEWQTACRVWDTKPASPSGLVDYGDDTYGDSGYGLPAKQSDDGVLQWQRVFRTDHEWIGAPVIDNGHLRLIFNETYNTLDVEQWDAGTSSWTNVSLGTSDWEFFEIDLRDIGASRITALLEFRDPTTSPTSYYTLRAIVRRGFDTIQFDRTGLEDAAVPDGLQDLLDPIASTSIEDPGETQTLVRRSEVR